MINADFFYIFNSIFNSCRDFGEDDAGTSEEGFSAGDELTRTTEDAVRRENELSALK